MVKCSWCETLLDSEEKGSPHRDNEGRIICDDCYNDEYRFNCAKCGELVDLDGAKFFILTFGGNNNVDKGVYEILKFPFYVSNVIGTDEIDSQCVKKVREVSEEEIGCNGYICSDCAV